MRENERRSFTLAAHTDTLSEGNGGCTATVLISCNILKAIGTGFRLDPENRSHDIFEKLLGFSCSAFCPSFAINLLFITAADQLSVSSIS